MLTVKWLKGLFSPPPPPLQVFVRKDLISVVARATGSNKQPPVTFPPASVYPSGRSTGGTPAEVTAENKERHPSNPALQSLLGTRLRRTPQAFCAPFFIVPVR